MKVINPFLHFIQSVIRDQIFFIINLTTITGGISNPYEYKCKLVENKEGYFEYKGTENDYPSLSAVQYQLRKKEKSLVFGIADYYDHFYEQLVDQNVLDAKVGSLGSGKSPAKNLEKLIVKTYKEIKDEIRVIALNTDKDVNITFKIPKNNNDCTTKNQEVSCSKAKVDEEIEIIAVISINENLCDSSSEIEFKVFGQEGTFMTVQLEPDCECDCMKNPQQNSDQCSNNGNLTCGTCYCYDNYYGDQCECGGDSVQEDEDNEKCIINDQECSGRGTCSCGKCKCVKPEHFGKYCECNKDDCNCGNHGECDTCASGKAVCTCDKGWEEDEDGKCECQIGATENCLDPVTKKVCNEKGTCSCNKCQCQNGRKGDFCQQPEDYSIENTCQSLEPCAKYLD